MNVSAKDKATGKEQSIRIEASSGLSDEEIEKMKKDAEAHADDDKKKRDLIDAKNTADTMIYTTEKMMKDVEEKKIEITDDERKGVESSLAKLKEIKDGDDLEVLKKASDDLATAGQIIGTKMYQQEQAKTQAEANSTEAPKTEEGTEEKKEEEPIEGEVVEEKKAE